MLKRKAEAYWQRPFKTVTCPDTKLKFRTLYVPGEYVISPYTGRKFIPLKKQPSYFQPTSRDSLGRITGFMGDLANYNVPIFTARLFQDPNDTIAKAQLSIPGLMSQQFHFAGKNWARFYCVMGNKMTQQWRDELYTYIDRYHETKNYGNDGKPHGLLTKPHTFPGQKGEFLGGNPVDGGTENHKTMWRTTCLTYAENLPSHTKLSGMPVKEAGEQCNGMIEEYLKAILTVSNGEYDASIYYPHSIMGFMNLYDFAKKAKSKAMAKLALDYYTVSYGIKTIDGVHAGASKRGYLPSFRPGEMEVMLWSWTGNNSLINTNLRLQGNLTSNIHHLTTQYRPNKIITNIISKNVSNLPFEGEIARPSYYNEYGNENHEYFYVTKNYSMGSVYMSKILNPTQQIVWSLVAKGEGTRYPFSGSQPYINKASGHSPYTQTMQKEGAIIVATNNSIAKNFDKKLTPHAKIHDNVKNKRLEMVSPPSHPDSVISYFEKSKYSASTWLHIPLNVDTIHRYKNEYFIQAGKTFIYVHPICDKIFWMEKPDSITNKLGVLVKNRYKKDKAVVFQGKRSGFIFDVTDQPFKDIVAFRKHVKKTVEVDDSKFNSELKINYKSLNGNTLEFVYNQEALRCKGKINGNTLDFENWADGGTYKSPYLTIKDGVMKVSDGKEAYKVDFTGNMPVYFITTP